MGCACGFVSPGGNCSIDIMEVGTVFRIVAIKGCTGQGIPRVVVPASDHGTHLIVAEWCLVVWAMSFAVKPITQLKPSAI
jgi:hypothetical protein